MKPPHPLFAALWVARFLALLVALVVPGVPVWVLPAVAFSFFPIEAVGLFLDTGKRDQYSELMTWTVRRLSKHTRPFRGWNLLVDMVALVEGAGVYVLVARAGLPVALGGALVGFLLVFLHDHWLRPDIHG